MDEDEVGEEENYGYEKAMRIIIMIVMIKFLICGPKKKRKFRFLHARKFFFFSPKFFGLKFSFLFFLIVSKTTLFFVLYLIIIIINEINFSFFFELRALFLLLFHNDENKSGHFFFFFRGEGGVFFCLSSVCFHC